MFFQILKMSVVWSCEEVATKRKHQMIRWMKARVMITRWKKLLIPTHAIMNRIITRLWESVKSVYRCHQNSTTWKDFVWTLKRCVCIWAIYSPPHLPSPGMLSITKFLVLKMAITGPKTFEKLKNVCNFTKSYLNLHILQKIVITKLNSCFFSLYNVTIKFLYNEHFFDKYHSDSERTINSAWVSNWILKKRNSKLRIVSFF